MSWVDRLREAAYTAPDGTRQTFSYEDVSRATAKKTSVYTFADADGAFVQDTGRGGRRYPLRCIFHGGDYDTEAAAFEALLWQRGPGVLDHPAYGRRDVVPTGEIRRRDDLVSAANQAVIEVEFFETLDLTFPRSQDHPGDDVAAAIGDYNAASAGQFAALAAVDNAADRADLQGTYTRLLDGVSDSLSALASAQGDVQSQFDDIFDSINQGIDTLIRDPLSLAAQTSLMIQAPARAAQSIRDRLSAYSDLARSIISGRGADTSNQLASRDLYASGAVTGSVLSTLNHQFERRSDAFDAAEAVLAQFEAVQAWREEQYARTGDTDTGEAYQRLQQAVSLCAGFLVEISFDLAQERSIVTARPRTIIDLCAELYGEVDSRLDFLIETNGLSGDDILEVPAGRRIVYYP